jgi:hypothetical protein
MKRSKLNENVINCKFLDFLCAFLLLFVCSIFSPGTIIVWHTIRRTRIHKVICKSMYWNKFNIKFILECRDIFMISKNVASPYQSTNSSFENVECLEFHVFVIDFVVLCLFFSFAFFLYLLFYLNSFLMPIYVVFSSYRLLWMMWLCIYLFSILHCMWARLQFYFKTQISYFSGNLNSHRIKKDLILLFIFFVNLKITFFLVWNYFHFLGSHQHACVIVTYFEHYLNTDILHVPKFSLI